MDTLTHNGLVKRIAASKGVLIVGLLALVDCKARKTNNPYGTIFKWIRGVGFVGVDYERAVNREAIRQGETPEFGTESLPWGEWLLPNKVITHNGNLYLRTQTTPNQRRKQPAKVLRYENDNGFVLSKDEIKQFLPAPRESNKQQEETGIDSTVWVRTYKFDSIYKIRIAGKTYLLKQ